MLIFKRLPGLALTVAFFLTCGVASSQPDLTGWNNLIRSMESATWVHDLETLEPGSVLGPCAPDVDPERWRKRSIWAENLAAGLEVLPLSEHHADRALKRLLADGMLVFRLMETAADRYRHATETAFEHAGLAPEWALLPMALTGWDNAYYGPGRRAGAWAMDVPAALHHGLRIERGWDERHLPERMTPAAVAQARKASLAFPDDPLRQIICFVRGRRAAQDIDLESLDSGLLEWLHLLRVILQADRNFNRDDTRSLWLLRDKRLGVSSCGEDDVLYFSLMDLDGADRLAIRQENPWYTTDSVTLRAERPALIIPMHVHHDGTELDLPCGVRPTRNAPIPIVQYVVRPGDVLGTIARDHGVRIDEIRQENQLAGDMIRVGQVLDIPGGVARQIARETPPSRTTDSWIWHTVKEGESYWTISSQYSHAGLEDIMEMNETPPEQLRPGMKIRIPPP